MTKSSEEAIRAAREAINQAITRRDPAAIGEFLLPHYHVVTARSMHRDGKDASVRSWEDMFRRDETATYDRTPVEIHINEGWGMAEEHGRWSGTLRTIDGPLSMDGVYAAKWHLTEDGWRLEAEIYTPLTITRS